MGAIHANDFTEEMFRCLPKGLLGRGPYLRVENSRYDDDRVQKTYNLFNNKHKKIVTFRARQMPGCCGVLVVYYLRPTDGKDTKLFSSTLKIILEAAKASRFGSVLLTQTAGSLGYQTLTTEFPQAQQFSFRNAKTDNLVCTFQLNLEQPAKEKKAQFDEEF